jgi:WD40 repeat protein
MLPKSCVPTKVAHLQSLFKNATTKSFQAHNSKIHSVAWNVDGRRLASGSTDKTVAIFTFENREKLVSLIKPSLYKSLFKILF